MSFPDTQTVITPGGQPAPGGRTLAEVLLRLSTTFVAAPAGAVDARINDALALIGQATESDRAYVFRLLEDGVTVRNTHEWCAPGIPAEIDNLQALPTEEMNDAWLLLAAGEVVHLPDVAGLDESWAGAREILLEQGIQSLVLVPMPGPSGTAGFIGFDAVRGRREWADHEVAVLRIVGDLFQVALQRDEAERRLAHRELHDDLTGLPNRALLGDRLDVALRRRGRLRDSVAVLFVDLDQFKLVNESLGHATGDEVLGRCAERLVAAVRPGDTVSRFGADEFVVVCEDVDGVFEAQQVADRLTAALAQPLQIDGHELVLTACVGATVAAEGERSGGRLLQRADVALRQAKAAGRGAIRLLDADSGEAVVDRLTMEGELRRALDREELHLAYQPIIDTASGQMTGVEALVRWTHPTRGPVLPLDFIPMAERSGMIIPLGRWVLERATLDICMLSEHLRRDLSVAVNVSARQLLDPTLATDVEQALERSGLTPDLVVLEVTETALIDDPRAAIEAVGRLRAIGVRLALDDFGTGWSSLAYLRDLRIDRLKIDRSFVADLGDRSTHDIVRSVVQLAHGLGLEVVAEGVETEEVLAAVAALGCEQWQGYLCSKAVPIAELASERPAAPSPSPEPGSLQGIADGLGVEDLFVFRRVAAGRYAHLGGIGRGEAWAGIVELDSATTSWAAGDLPDGVHRLRHGRPERVFGPYYAQAAFVTAVPPDAVVLGGRARSDMAPMPDAEVQALAERAVDLVDAVSPAKRLSDELELLEAVHGLLQFHGSTTAGALHHIVRCATDALSCEVGAYWHAESGLAGVVDSSGKPPFDDAALRSAAPELAAVASRGACCGQDASTTPLPHPLDTVTTVRSWYLVPLPASAGFLLLLHTDRAPRGFTDLCLELGRRLAEAAGMVLEATRGRERLKLEIARVSSEARTDPLTLLPNRLAWEEAVAARRADHDACTAIVVADLDGLKRTNDTVGHHGGDALLRSAAELLRRSVRAGDLVARIGGDEFGLLLPGMCADACSALVDELRRRVDGSQGGSRGAPWSLALGFAVCEPGGDLEAALREADAAMYAAKRSSG